MLIIYLIFFIIAGVFMIEIQAYYIPLVLLAICASYALGRIHERNS